MNDTKFIEINKRDEGVVEVRLNRPELHNAFNDEFIQELTTCFKDLSSDGTVRLLILSGEGKSFCAGADLNWMKAMKNYSDEENYEDSVKLSNLFSTLNDCPFPVIAKINGATLGGGTGLIAACDFVIAAEEARFGFTEVGLGLVPAVISPYVVNKIGESFARAYFLSGERFDAYEALRMNLVHKVVSLSDLNQAVEKQVERFLRAGPQAAREAKTLIKGVFKREPHSENLRDFTCKTIARVRTTPEGQEGMTALLEKRKPKWIQPQGEKS
ncbi:MAG: enoyl-CoA hydratase-related protein [Halobacteriovoraceae bacterium]|nr:enoyl-CoA hydratase-related protein [Halobacteriovoraceae bacterium]